MFFERSEVGKLVGMTGCLSMLFILTIVIMGASTFPVGAQRRLGPLAGAANASGPSAKGLG